MMLRKDLAIKHLLSLQLGMHWFPERQGGLDRVYYELARALPHSGVDVCGLVAGSPRAAMDTHGAIRAFAPQNQSLLGRWSGMRKAFAAITRERHPDLIVSHFALYTLPIIGKLKSPLVIHFHGPLAEEGAFGGHPIRCAIKRWVENSVYKRASRAIVLSNAFAELLADKYDISKDRIDVIPGGIDTKYFAVPATRDEARARMGWPLERPIVVSVRRLVPRMGLENLLEAVKIIKQDIPNIMVMIAGKGVLQAQLAAQIESLGISDNVTLLGFVSDEDLPYIYRAANLSVVPTMALEGFGLIAAESLAAGTPCLVSPVGGLPEVVSALSKDLVLASPSAPDIAQKLTAALTGELILPGETECRRYAAENFDWDIIASRVAKVYRQAMV